MIRRTLTTHISLMQTIDSRRWAAPFFAVLALTAACSAADAPDDATRSATPDVLIGAENIAILTTTTLASGPSLSGQLKAARSASIRAEVPGAVLTLLVEPGDRVRAGAVLARLDDAAIRDSWLSARSGVTAAQTAADQATREAERAERLLAAGAIATRDAEAARRGALAATAQFADAQARLSAAQKQLDATTVTAPFDGIIAERPVSAGDIVAPGAPLFVLVDPSSMRLEAVIPASALTDVQVGMPVRFRVSGYGARSFEGRVTQVNPSADPATGQVRLYASLPNGSGTLVSGLFAEGRVATASREALGAPFAAIDQRGLRPVVVRLRNGTVERVEVVLGVRDDGVELVEVTGAVSAGDTVLLGTAQGITAGTAVRVSAPTDTTRY
jgi:membrane fusion protein (multidrug efflux system)